MDPKAYAIHKRLREQTGQRFHPTSSRQHKGPKEITIPLIRPPENCENRKPHVVDYDPLPTPTSIRVLQVHPEEPENEFEFYSTPRCSLVVKDLDDHPIYDALSYTWGCPVTVYSDESEVSSAAAWAAPSFDIICNGKPFSVTANLYAAILSLRLQASTTSIRYCRTMETTGSNMIEIISPILHIWIDQICINQSDLQERNSQVTLMGRIYKQSRLCLVWLGGDDQFSQTALDTMVKVLNVKPESFSKLAARNIFQTKTYHDIGMEPIEPWEWITLYAFLSRSWFWRSWVVQEAALPRRLSFVCGITPFSLDCLCYLMDLLRDSRHLGAMRQFARALQGYSNTFTKQAEAMRAQDPGASLYQPNPADRPNHLMLKRLFEIRILAFGFQSSIYQFSKAWRPDYLFGLSNVLALFQTMKATDPRDKVYAFLGLAEELGQTGTLRPAYEKPIAEVFRDAIKFMLQSSNSLSALALKEDPQQTKTPGLKSWVPDFTSHGLISPGVHQPLNVWTVGEGAGNTYFTFHPGGDLEVRGLRIGTACAAYKFTGLDSLVLDDGPSSFMNLVQALPECSNVWIPPLTSPLRLLLDAQNLIPNKEIYNQPLTREEGTIVRQPRLEVLWRTLLRNNFGEEFPPLKGSVDLILAFWDSELHARMAIAGMNSDNNASSGQSSTLYGQIRRDSRNWDTLKSSISRIYCAQRILKGQHGDDVQNELFPEEMSAILPELDAAWAEGRRSDEGAAMAKVASKEPFPPSSAEVNEFDKVANMNCLNKSLFATKEGQLGAGPKSTREGDEIWNLVGADGPSVLRPQGDGRYTLVGAAYVHGAMFAEWHEGDFDAIAKDIKTISIV